MTAFTRRIKVYFSPDKVLHKSLRNLLGFHPSNISLYKLAFRHSSAAQLIKKGVKDSNERLEFLGDSVIGTVVADYLFKKFPYKDEGFLTKMRSKMVSRAKHNQVAVKLGLKKFIEVNNDRFKTAQPTSIGGDAYEALIGAIYLDKGFKTAQNFILTRIINIHIDMDEVETKEIDFKSKFIEWVQKEKKDYRFEVVNDGGNTADKQFVIQLVVDNEIVGTAQHISKKRAEQMVAEQACMILEI
ncbi:MAG: ribonuclease III [Bacteroidota bacterium]